jgi:spermidine synthase
MRLQAAMRNRSSEPRHWCRAGRIHLSESGGVRYLHFGTVWVQGAMRIRRPYALELEYQQQMMAPILFIPRPAHVVQFGLGAAALTKFCWRYVESCRVVAVDIDARVVEAARRWFGLPRDDERLSVQIADARKYLRRVAGRCSADWLQVDLYDAGAKGPVCDDVPFYKACRGILRSPGVAAFNLFGRGFDRSFGNIAQAFEGRALVLPESDAGNRVALAFSGPRVRLTWTELRRAAEAIESRLRLPARKWVEGLWRENGLEEGGGVGNRVLVV